MASPNGFIGRIRARLNSGDSWLTRDIRELLPAGRAIDGALFEELESRLLLADFGVETTEDLIGALRARRDITDADSLLDAIASELRAVLGPCSVPLVIDPRHKPFVILVVGVNGTGKTTTIGKLARRFRQQGLKVMLAAADTYRAAAIGQLQAWGERDHVPVIARATGSDPAAVAFDALEAARARGTEVLLVDTAGRLHTRTHLMDELRKVHRVLGKAGGDAPHETLLVLDATTGQNALTQAVEFNAAVPLTGIVMTKLDGTAKGGILVSVARGLGVPVRYIGIGEQADDLGEFDAGEFIDAMLDRGAA